MEPEQNILSTTVEVPEVHLTCKYCHLPVTLQDFYCPHCGKKLKDKPVSTDLWPLVWLFVLSTLLPPLGIGLTIRYIKSEDQKAKSIGWISLMVTGLALIAAVYASKAILDVINSQVSSQMQNYNF